MPRANRYASVNAKIGAERSNLLKEEKFKSLMQTRSLEGFAGSLRETVYGENISKIPLPYSSSSIERALRENLIDVFIKIIRNSPPNVSEFLKIHLRQIEVENLKTIMRGIISQMNEKQKRSRVYLSVEEFLKKTAIFEKALDAADLKQLVDALRDSEYAEAVSQGVKSYEENGTTICFEVLVDKVFYEMLYESFQLLPINEKSHARFFTDIESTSYILLTVLRGKNLKHESNWLRVALPDKHFLKREFVETLVTSESFNSALGLVLKSPYAEFFSKQKTPEEMVSLAEKNFKKTLHTHALKTRVTENFSVGLPLAFMYLKENEVRKLAGFSVGLESGADAADLEKINFWS